MEVCYNNIYYPVCDLGWTERDAVVVCNNVGYYGYGELAKTRGNIFMVVIFLLLKGLQWENLVCQMNLRYFRPPCAVELSTISVIVLGLLSTTS